MQFHGHIFQRFLYKILQSTFSSILILIVCAHLIHDVRKHPICKIERQRCNSEVHKNNVPVEDNQPVGVEGKFGQEGGTALEEGGTALEEEGTAPGVVDKHLKVDTLLGVK